VEDEDRSARGPGELGRISRSYTRLKKRENTYLKKLVKHYPDHRWAEKYVKSGRGLSVPGILAFHVLDEQGFHSLWTDEATLDDCKLILRLGLSITTVIYIEDGTPHSIAIQKYKPRRKEFIFYDPMGSYNTNYLFRYNTDNWITEDKLVELNAGDPIHAMITISDNRVLPLLKRIFSGKRIYLI